MAHFVAGCSIGDLSPWVGVDLGGYPYFDRENTGIHDPLYGTCLYLETEDKKKLLLLAGDLCYLTKAQADRVKNGITSKCGLLTDEMIISCSHSHSAPWMSRMYKSFPGQPEYESEVDQKYVDFIVGRWSDIAKEAVLNTFPAEYAYTKTYCGKTEGIGGNRTDPENGETDPSIPVLVIRKKGGPVMAIHTKYALHPTILHGENKLVSADYPGYIRKYINERYPAAVFMFSQGTSGNQSPRYYRKGQTFSEAERFGYAIGEKIASAMTDLEYTSDLSIYHETMVLDIKMKNYSDPEMLRSKVEYYRKEKENVIRDSGSYTDIQKADMWLLGSECEYNYASMQKEGRISEYYSDDIPFTAHIAVLNGCAYVFLQGELFVEYGLKIKLGSPFTETNVITVSNGMMPGYCVTPDVSKIGGYEAWNSMLASDTGDKIVTSVTEMLMKIHENNREEKNMTKKVRPFPFTPAPFIPFRDKVELERVRNMSGEELTHHKNPDFKIRIVKDDLLEHIFVTDMFAEIKLAAEEGRKVVLIIPNPNPGYRKLAMMINRFHLDCKHVYTFNMDEWADQDGNIAPETYAASFMRSTKKFFYGEILPELRMPESQMVGPSTKNITHYSDMIEQAGGADVCYSGPGWTGHLAFIEPDVPEFAGSLEEFLKMGARVTTLNPLTIAQNSLHGCFGCSGDLANVPPKAATIGPRDVFAARRRMEMHGITTSGTFVTWQRMISRLVLHGPVTPSIPSSILQLVPTDVYITETLAAPIEPDWEFQY